MRQRRGTIAALAVGWMLAGGLAAAEAGEAAQPAAVTTTEAAPAAAEDAFSFFLQEAEVVTASRRAQKKSDSPVAIDVITHDEIEKSGAQSLYELLRFRVGVDVVEGNSIEGNPALVNVRGLPEEFSQSLQVLVDGRSIVATTNSGVYWRRLPVDLEEIERVEIVRGPNSALFGANAGQGVINIITKAPGSRGGSNSVIGTGGLYRNKIGIEAAPGAAGVAVRGSYSSGRRDSYPDTTGNISSGGNRLDREERARIRVTAKPWEDGSVDLSAGLLREAYVYPLSLGVGGSTAIESDYALLKVGQQLNEAVGLELNASRREERTSAFVGSGRETVMDVDALSRISLGEGSSQTIVGVSLRYGEAEFPGLFSNSSHSSSLYRYSTSTDDEFTRLNRLRRAYLSEQLSLSDWMIVSVAGSYEGSDNGGEQPAYQGAVILKPVQDWSLRMSGSKSPTMPSLLNKYSRLELVTGLSGGNLNVYRVQGSDITPPQVASYEATLQGSVMDRRLTAEVTGFQMEISGYPDFQSIVPAFSIPSPGFGAPGKNGQVLEYRNQHDLLVRGSETVLTYKPSKGIRLQANHTYMDVTSAKTAARYEYTTPYNKANLFGAAELFWGFNIAGGVNFIGEHRAHLASKSSTIKVPDQAKVDLRLGYKPHADVELYAVGQNLAHAYRTEAPDGLAIPQTYVAGLNLAWGH